MDPQVVGFKQILGHANYNNINYICLVFIVGYANIFMLVHYISKNNYAINLVRCCWTV